MSVIFISLDISSNCLFTIPWSQVTVFLSSHRQLKKSVPKVAKLRNIAKIIWNFQMRSGIPLSALTVFRKWSKEKTYKLGQHGLARQPGPTNNRPLSSPSFPSRHERIFACTVCASLADELFLPPQHPEDEQWVYEALAWHLQKRKHESCCICVYICNWTSKSCRFVHFNKSRRWGRGASTGIQHLPSSWEEQTTLMQELWRGFYRGTLCQLNQY